MRPTYALRTVLGLVISLNWHFSQVMSQRDVGSEGGHSKLTFEEEFSRHDDATIIIRRNKQHGTFSTIQAEDEDALEVNITAFNRIFSLKLRVNKYLIHPSYIEKTVNSSGSFYYANANTTTRNCYYIGNVVNDSNSAAAVSTCSGLRAQISLAAELYHIEPLDGSLHGRHRAYRQTDSKLPPFKCGHGRDVSPAEMLKLMRNRLRRDTLNWPQGRSGTTKVIEFYAANALSQYQVFGNDLNRVSSRAKNVVNFASALYQPLNVYVTLVGMETWNSADVITVNYTDSSSTLNSFARYREKNINPLHKNDHAQLFVSNGFESGIIGLAYIGEMCSLQLSASLTSDVRADVGYTATVSAHELGHSLNMIHDNQYPTGYCTCSDPVGHCIMYASASITPPTQWSSCSQSVLSNFLTNYGYCLNDFNGALYDSTAVCGNGIVEAGEQCDCGKAPNTVCNSTCCNPSTCQLVASAGCASGLCCDVGNCQLKPAGTLCRSVAGQCDLAEYCSGVNDTCPSDAYKRDGTTCTSNGKTTYCYSGSCRSRDSQCQMWWGPTIGDAVSQCYTKFNTEGGAYGNCGNNSMAGDYPACSPSNAFCGLLHCNIRYQSFTQLKLSYPGQVLIYGSSLTLVSSGSLFANCTSGYYWNGDPSLPDAGYVSDGTACDSDMMCVNRQCVSTVNVLNRTSCPDCNQNGVCNNLGQCHCDFGYAPPNCSQPGDGGSYHSNPNSLNLTEDGSSTISTAVVTGTTAVAQVGGGSSLSTAAIIGVSVSAAAGGAIIIAVVVVVVIKVKTGVTVAGAIPAAAAAARVGTAPTSSASNSNSFGYHNHGYNDYGYHSRFPQPPRPVFNQ